MRVSKLAILNLLRSSCISLPYAKLLWMTNSRIYFIVAYLEPYNYGAEM